MGSEATLQHRKIWYDRKSIAIHGRNMRQAVPKLLRLSPTLAEALAEIERTIQKIHQIESTAIDYK